MKFLNLSQGSEEWISERRKWLTASEVASVLGIPGAFKKRDAVLKEKVTGQAEEVSEFTQRLFDRGHAAEVSLREAAQIALGMELKPAVALREDIGLLASMDGINEEQGVVVEMKYSTSAKVLDAAKAGVAWEPYRVQIQAQMLVTGYEKAALFVMDGDGHSWLLRVVPDFTMQDTIRAAAVEFIKDIRAGFTGEMQVTDEEMSLLRKLLHKVKDIEEEIAGPLALLKSVEKQIDPLKKKIAEKYSANLITGYGVEIKKSKPVESLDRAALEKAGFDLKPYLKLQKPRTSAELAKSEGRG